MKLRMAIFASGINAIDREAVEMGVGIESVSHDASIRRIEREAIRKRAFTMTCRCDTD